MPMHSKKILLAVSIILFLALSLMPIGLFVSSQQASLSIGPSITIWERAEPIPEICLVIDYMQEPVEPVNYGWPMTTAERGYDECGAYFSEPNDYLYIYPLGILLNATLATGPTLLLAKIKKRKTKSEQT